MWIRLLKTTVCNGSDVVVGDKVETDRGQGKILIRMGKAIEIDAPVKETPPKKKRGRKLGLKKKQKTSESEE